MSDLRDIKEYLIGKYKAAKDYVLDRLASARPVIVVLVGLLSERSTWQGIGFFVGLLVSKEYASLDWGLAAAVGGSLSAAMKFWPDKKDNV